MNKDIGQTLSFYEMMKGEVSKLEIPIIQRDYAQGRSSAKDIRINFLKTIKKHLDEDKILSLDFVFGSMEDERFIPIDGQQRLTTLFLLHWYLAWATENQVNYAAYLGESCSKFTYETRISSRDFCNALVKERVENDPATKISDQIKDQHWFYMNWSNDPTIMGMLNTLDSIQEIFDDHELYYEKLISTSPAPITFEFIELKDFGLSDQLYIKMNSRGKPLTEFENLKANVEKIFEERDKAEGTNQTFWLTSNMDGAWTDLFWNFLQDKSRLVDGLFMNFLRVSLTNYYTLANKDTPEKELDMLLDSSQRFSFFMIESIALAAFEPLYEAFYQLEKLSDNSGDLIEHIKNEKLLDVRQLFDDLVHDSTSYPKRIQFYALCSYLTNDFNPLELENWIRVIRNLTENSRIETADDYAEALQTTHKLLKYAETIETYLTTASSSDLVGFSNYQSDEEVLKARLLRYNPSWKDRIEELEDHPYLQGQITFILNFSGIDDAVEQRSKKPLDPSVDKACLDIFEKYVACFQATFTKNGIQEFNDFLFERALLSIGDYTLAKSRNWSFLINGNERDISWKRYLRSDQVSYLKGLFDIIDLDDLECSLSEIVKNYKRKDFRHAFINYPEMIEKTGKNRFFRWYGKNNILLLEKTQTNGMHREYYSYAICCELRSKGADVVYHPDCYEEEGSKYIESINGKEVYVYQIPKGNYKYFWVESDFLKEKKVEFKSHRKVVEFLEKHFL